MRRDRELATMFPATLFCQLVDRFYNGISIKRFCWPFYHHNGFTGSVQSDQLSKTGSTWLSSQGRDTFFIWYRPATKYSQMNSRDSFCVDGFPVVHCSSFIQCGCQKLNLQLKHDSRGFSSTIYFAVWEKNANTEIAICGFWDNGTIWGWEGCRRLERTARDQQQQL